MRAVFLTGVLAWGLMRATASLAAPLPEPARDDEVVEVLPGITHMRPPPVNAAVAARPPNPTLAARSAREAINVARQTGDARYWGRAESALAPWWDKADAPPDLAILQATVQQGRHMFGPARTVLQDTLARAPQHAQGWLDLAALDRVEARYADALAACAAVGRAGQALYARACELETLSLQGRQQMAGAAFRQLLADLPARGAEAQRSWLYSLLAESEERARRPAEARAAYAQSLAAEPDLYTVIAFSDLLLRIGDNAAVGKLLAGQPLTDAVLLRQALALRRLNDAGWTALRDELHAREAALDRRGDNLDLHDRERALLAWWLDDAPARALGLALRNLELQREPIDWWIALEVAIAARDLDAAARIRQRLQATGLQDKRLVAR